MRAVVFATGLAFLAGAGRAQEMLPRLQVLPGDTIALVGNALAERMQHDGWLESRLHTQFPEHQLTIRNLGFSGDTVDVRQRTSGFGSPDDHLHRIGADVVLGFFGFVESFRGEEGLEPFRTALADWIAHTREERYGGELTRIALFASIPFEEAGNPLLPAAAERNGWIQHYNTILRSVAFAEGVPFVDLYESMRRRYAGQRRNRYGPETLTLNGIHLNWAGNGALAQEIQRELFGPNSEWIGGELRELVQEKNLLWFNRYRATDGYNVYGGRSTLAYTPGQPGIMSAGGTAITNYEVLQRELEALDAMCANVDRRIWLAAGKGDSQSVDPVAVPALLEVATNRPGPEPDGSYRFLGGDEAVSRMTVADGMEVNLFASEEDFPELANPVQMAFDPAGRLWVAVWPTYPHWKPGEPMNDKLVVLEDTDGDGRADKSTIFADDLHNPTGLEFWNGGVFVANCPDLLFLKDTDGDAVADERERVLHGLSSADTHHGANSFVLGPDGALYFQEGTFHMSQVESIYGPMRNQGGCVWRFEPRTWRVERYVPYGFANPHGHVFDRWGQDFVTDGTGNVNYFALGFSGHLPSPERHRGYFPFFQQRSRPAGGTEILSSRHFPDANQGNYLVANVIGFQGIFQYEVAPEGSGYGAVEVEPIVHSSDPNFRPVDMEVGPDGALYFLDWHNPLIGHMQHHLRDPSRDAEHGRVYRVTYPGRALLEPEPIAGRPVAELVRRLGSPEDRVRYRARLELSARDTDEVVAAARAWAASVEGEDKDAEHELLEALWLQQQHGVLDEALLARMLGSPEPGARAAAVRVLRQMRHVHPDPLPLLRAAAEDSHPLVRLEVVVGASFFPAAEAAEIALRASSGESDRFLDYALPETLRALEPYWREALVTGAPFCADDPAGLALVLERLATEDLKRARPAAAVQRELLARHDAETADLVGAATALAAEQGTAPGVELLAAIERADTSASGHADHVLMGLFDAWRALPAEERGATSASVRELATSARRGTTRRLATVARVLADGSLEPAWEEARRSPGGLGDFLDAATLLDDPALTAALFPRALELFEGSAQASATADEGTRGRFVRIELPGEERTLTLAEVEVLHRGVNLAPAGTATQSTVNWSGVPERAMDGNKSGSYGDGGQTHTVEDLPNPWWELDLGAEQPIESIVIWNRTEGPFASRLDGFVLRVLDGERRTVFRHTAGRAPAESLVLDVSDPALRVRRASARVLGSLGANEPRALEALVAHFDDLDVRASVVESVRSIPSASWTPETVGRLAQALQRVFDAGRPSDFDNDPGRELLALADEVAQRMSGAEAAALRLARAQMGPRVVVLRPIRDAMVYDRTEFTVVAGHPVELVFDNVDIMPHNVLVTVPGALAAVGMAAEAMAQDPGAWARSFVPEMDEVLWSTRLLQPGESQTLRFDAPTEPGAYPYVCTFPGHWVRMNGVMRVVGDWAEMSAEATVASDASEASGRAFVQSWSVAALRPYLAGVDDASPERGREVFEAASCQQCHAVRGEGGNTGPELTEVVPTHDRLSLVTQLLEPSSTILDGYGSEIFVLTDGTIVSGRVMADEGDVLLVRDDPYRDDSLELPLADIAERAVSSVSAMPDGLLSTFVRADVLALVAYLESLAE